LRLAEPLKMTSIISLPRRLLGLWSPRIHLIESTTLLFPEPLGPTTQVTPGEKSKRVRSAKLLKPNNSSDLSILIPRPVCRREWAYTLLSILFSAEQLEQAPGLRLLALVTAGIRQTCLAALGRVAARSVG